MLCAEEIYQQVLDGTVARFPNGFWVGEDGFNNALACFKYLIESVLGLNSDTLIGNIEYKIILKYRLSTPYKRIFNCCMYDIAKLIYPNKFKRWDFGIREWHAEVAIEATKWLIENKLKWSDADIIERLSADTFIDNGFGGLLRSRSNSPYLLIELAYPNKFLIMDFRITRNTLHAKVLINR